MGPLSWDHCREWRKLVSDTRFLVVGHLGNLRRGKQASPNLCFDHLNTTYPASASYYTEKGVIISSLFLTDCWKMLRIWGLGYTAIKLGDQITRAQFLGLQVTTSEHTKDHMFAHQMSSYRPIPHLSTPI